MHAIIEEVIGAQGCTHVVRGIISIVFVSRHSCSAAIQDLVGTTAWFTSGRLASFSYA